MLDDLAFRLRALFRRRAVEAELDEELRFHFEHEVAKHLAAGRTREQAERLSRLAFGGLDRAKEECRRARGVELIDTLAQDLAYGLRMLRKYPAFSAIAVLTLALGIGANTALFSVVNGVLFKPLPFPHAEQLVRLNESKPNFENGSISYPNFRDWRQQNRTFAALAIARGYDFSMTGRGDAEQVKGTFVSSEFFDVLGVRPVVGRGFAAGEDEIGAPPAALISAAFWKRKLGGAPDALGKSLTLEGRDYPIIGVIPASFAQLLPPFSRGDVYLPIGQWSNNLLPKRGAGLGIHGVGRLKPGVTIEQARADMEGVTRGLAAAYPDVDKGIGATLVPLKNWMVGTVRPLLLVLLGAVGFVLLIACVNVANLLLARSTGRAREFAVRAALGASQGRMVRQLLTESILLAAAGGGLGLLVAAWGTRAALAALPSALPRAAEVGLDGRVLIFTLAISLAAGTLFGLAPALKASRPTSQQTLKEGGRGSSGARHRAQGVFVVVEMAMALVLLIGAGLMIRSLAKLWRVDPGFQPHHVLTFGLVLPPPMMTASPATVRAAFRELDAQLAPIPGLEALSPSWGALPMGEDDEGLFWLDGHPKPASDHEMSWALRYRVEPDYLKAMRIPLQRGRFFTPHDDEHSPAVAVIDEVFAHQYFGGEDPLHKFINLDDGNVKAEIVGVVGHVKQWGLDTDDQGLRAQLYQPFMQLPDPAMALASRGTDIVVRSAGDRPGLFDAIRRRLRAMNGEHVVYGAQTMDERIAASLAARRFSMVLFGVFAALALVLASVGIYGVTSYLVGQKTHEIGVRMALGARRLDVLRLVLSQGAKLAALGLAIGIAAALGLTHLMSGLLFGISAADPPTFAGVALVLALVTLAACYVPARRGMSVDPTVALRCE